ncbi:MAG TPA: RsbRD N-terminal domain-containing protein [Syntrophobacteria bacterium]|nr:RsbRD N-terminal domain-containing protein [Syntrophobacteria bacterium]
MDFARVLEGKKGVILDRWFDLVLETYPADTQRFLKKQKSRFGNPVAHEISQGIEGVFDQLVKGASEEAISPFLDRIVRVRAVQEFTPAQALGFIFGLKGLIREELAGSTSPAELIECEARIDRLALLAFNIYMKCKEQIFQLRVDEVKNRVGALLRRAKLVCDLSETDTDNRSLT